MATARINDIDLYYEEHGNRGAGRTSQPEGDEFTPIVFKLLARRAAVAA